MAKDTKFKPGQSGNPKGRPPNTGKLAKLRSLLEPHASDLVDKAKDMALNGDTTALRLCLERLVPPIKEDSVHIEGLTKDLNLVEQGGLVLEAIASGEITPGQGAKIMHAIASQARILEVNELEERIAALESVHK